MARMPDNKKDISLSQLRVLVAVCDNNLNVTAAAAAVGLSQSSVSKKIISLERAIGKPLFHRSGKRFRYRTDICVEVVRQAREALSAHDNLIRIKDRIRSTSKDEMVGKISIGTTHTQARYVLPGVLRQFHREYPQISISICQGAPLELTHLLAREALDLVLCTEQLEGNENFSNLGFYEWNRCLVVLPDHPLAQTTPLKLRHLSAHPIITYNPGFTGRGIFDATFEKADIETNVTVSAIDADVIKTYVRLGFGVGIVAEMACGPESGDEDLVVRPLGHLFPPMRTRLAHLNRRYLSSPMQRFVEIFDQWTKTFVPLGPECTTQPLVESHPQPSPSKDEHKRSGGSTRKPRNRRG